MNESPASTSLRSVAASYNNLHDDFQFPKADEEFLSPIQLAVDVPIPQSFLTDPVQPKETTILFFALHYVKYKLSTGHDNYSDLFVAIRNKLVNANMPLVYAMVKKYSRRDNAIWDELISKSSECLMRSVEMFDPWRGFKFSTYACRSIRRECWKILQKQLLSNKPEVIVSKIGGKEIIWEDHDKKQEDVEILLERLRIQLIDIMWHDGKKLPKCGVTTREWAILRHRFGLNGCHKDGPKTLQQINEILGISKERIRQIQNKALKKIQIALEKDPLISKS